MEIASSPRTVEEIFKDYSARRTAVVRALTYGNSNSPLPLSHLTFLFWISLTFCRLVGFFLADVDEFYGLCDPGKCLIVDQTTNFHLINFLI